jgi:acyl-[acyl-carrier-protein]-phospholipid O-acyltransferase/long-chain-fatty-acid--[acyl-carrier-protein] ligase
MTNNNETGLATHPEAPNQFGLLASRRFLPLFLTQFLGAFNDNALKNALVILITFVVADEMGLNAQVMVTVAAGLYILPFFLFSATAGQVADKFDKAMLIRWVKVAEIALMVLAGVGFLLQSVNFLMVVLFLMGTQSTFFGPLKYSVLPEQLEPEELIGGNALFQGATFVAILLGTIIGGLLVLEKGGVGMVSALIIVVAVGGWLSSRQIPAMRAANPVLAIDYNLARQTWRILAYTAARRDIFLCILGLSWFWFVGATYLAQAPIFVKETLGGDQEVVTLFLSVFSIGIALGSLLCNRLLKGQVHATYVPLGAIGMSIFSIDLFFAGHGVVHVGPEGLMGAAAFLQSAANWRVMADLLLIAMAGGLYVVPLNALLQHRSDPEHRARNIAGNNIMNALFMVLSAAVALGLLELGVSVPGVLLVVALANVAVAIYISRLLPGALAKAVVAWLLDVCFRVEVTGLENFEKAGDKVLIVANHQSFLDPALLAAYVPDRLTFAINTYIAKNRIIKYFTQLAETYPMDPGNPYAMRSLIDCVNDLKKTVIFPEGRITVTGSLMKVYEGPGMIADKSGAMVLPVRIEGAQYSHFSRLRGKVRLRLFPKIRLHFMAPRRLQVPEEVKGRRRRQIAGRMLHDLMTDMIFETSDRRRTLFESLLDARAAHGGEHLVFEDIERRPLSYRKLVLACFTLGRALARPTASTERVGVLLPNSIGAAVTLFGLQAYGRVPAMLNFSTGIRNVVLGCETAQVKTVYSSRRFVEMAKLEEMIAAIEKAGVKVVFLEDVHGALTLGDKVTGVLGMLFPRLVYRLTARGDARDPDGEAVILFTSGTEGAPKGVVLSHVNLQANRHQVAASIDFGPTDIVLNALPMFHSFGLTCGTLLPALSGIKVFLYPSPLHYRIVPALAYDLNATLLFGTDTFLAGYARFAHPYDFYSMRYVFAGAEKLKDETRRLWSERYGVRIFEGYGATETAPVISMNSPMHNRPGSVGRLMPGIEYRLEPMPGVEEGGKLVVHGPNVMKGYLKVDQPGVLQPPEDGWYDTGDIVAIDDDGFVYIKGRAKRFAKIAGEMVSLPAVEEMAEAVWPGHRHAVVTIPDARKGEQVVLLTDCTEAARDALIAYARKHGVAEIGIPRNILVVDPVPLLGTGKTDYVTAKAIAEERLQ